jgi:hypothetical protein
MNPFVLYIFAAAVAVATCGAARADDARAMPLDRPVDVNGYDLACTGVGDEAREDPRWAEYPVRIEFANRDAQYLSDIDVAVQDANGEVLFAVLCQSPWLLAKLPPAKYTVTGTFEGITKSSAFTAPKSGQSRVVVTFVEVAGDR